MSRLRSPFFSEDVAVLTYAPPLTPAAYVPDSPPNARLDAINTHMPDSPPNARLDALKQLAAAAPDPFQVDELRSPPSRVEVLLQETPLSSRRTGLALDTAALAYYCNVAQRAALQKWHQLLQLEATRLARFDAITHYLPLQMVWHCWWHRLRRWMAARLAREAASHHFCQRVTQSSVQKMIGAALFQCKVEHAHALGRRRAISEALGTLRLRVVIYKVHLERVERRNSSHSPTLGAVVLVRPLRVWNDASRLEQSCRRACRRIDVIRLARALLALRLAAALCLDGEGTQPRSFRNRRLLVVLDLWRTLCARRHALVSCFERAAQQRSRQLLARWQRSSRLHRLAGTGFFTQLEQRVRHAWERWQLNGLLLEQKAAAMELALDALRAAWCSLFFLRLREACRCETALGMACAHARLGDLQIRMRDWCRLTETRAQVQTCVTLANLHVTRRTLTQWHVSSQCRMASQEALAGRAGHALQAVKAHRARWFWEVWKTRSAERWAAMAGAHRCCSWRRWRVASQLRSALDERLTRAILLVSARLEALRRKRAMRRWREALRVVRHAMLRNEILLVLVPLRTLRLRWASRRWHEALLETRRESRALQRWSKATRARLTQKANHIRARAEHLRGAWITWHCAHLAIELERTAAIARSRRHITFGLLRGRQRALRCLLHWSTRVRRGQQWTALLRALSSRAAIRRAIACWRAPHFNDILHCRAAVHHQLSRILIRWARAPRLQYSLQCRAAVHHQLSRTLIRWVRWWWWHFQLPRKVASRGEMGRSWEVWKDRVLDAKRAAAAYFAEAVRWHAIFAKTRTMLQLMRHRLLRSARRTVANTQRALLRRAMLIDCLRKWRRSVAWRVSYSVWKVWEPLKRLRRWNARARRPRSIASLGRRAAVLAWRRRLGQAFKAWRQFFMLPARYDRILAAGLRHGELGKRAARPLSSSTTNRRPPFVVSVRAAH